MFCPKCGEKNNSNQKFCSKCGADLTEASSHYNSIYEEELKEEQATVIKTHSTTKKLSIAMIITLICAIACEVASLVVDSLSTIAALVGVGFLIAFLVLTIIRNLRLKKLHSTPIVDIDDEDN